MKHSHHCHCGFSEKCQKFRAGKLGLLGGVLVVLHLLYHIAECLVLPAIFIAINGNSAEAAELSEPELTETTVLNDFKELKALRTSFYDSLEKYTLLHD